MARADRTPLISSRPAGHGQVGREHSNLALVDYSFRPTKNNRAQKLGGFWQTMGSAIAGTERSNRAPVADGAFSGLAYSIFPFEPDNWRLRFHDITAGQNRAQTPGTPAPAGATGGGFLGLGIGGRTTIVGGTPSGGQTRQPTGGGFLGLGIGTTGLISNGPTRPVSGGAPSRVAARDRVWSLTLSSDHNNKSGTSKHRSTMVTDQCDEQLWAFLQDAFWITEVKPGKDLVEDAGLHFNGAGIAILLGVGGKNKGKGQLAFNNAKNAAYITDGKLVAQLWHVLRITEAGSPGASGPGPGVTTTAEEVCAPDRKAHLALRGDVVFDYGSGLMQIVPEGEYADDYSGDILKQVKLFVSGDPAPLMPQLDPPEDKSSNQPELKRFPGYILRGSVKLDATYPPY